MVGGQLIVLLGWCGPKKCCFVFCPCSPLDGELQVKPPTVTRYWSDSRFTQNKMSTVILSFFKKAQHELTGGAPTLSNWYWARSCLTPRLQLV